MLLYLWLGFKLWMLIDAIKRRVELGWYLLLAMPAGAIVYFFVVKAPLFNIRQAPPEPEPEPIDLDALREAAQDSPSFHNRVAYAWGLLARGHHADALTTFETALRTHPAEKEALLGRGRALVALGRAEEAVEPLSEVVDRSFAYRDYAAAEALVEALEAANLPDEALALASRIARRSERYLHRLSLAELQHRTGHPELARATLAAWVNDFKAEPEFIQRRHQPLAARAAHLQAELG